MFACIYITIVKLFKCPSDAEFSIVCSVVQYILSDFDLDDDNMNTDDYDFGLERKEALSDWLSKTSQNTINQEIEEIKAKVSK